MTLIVAPQVMPVSDAGFTEMLMLTTWNGPGRLHMPVGATEDEVIEFPGLPTVSEPEMLDAELS